MIKRLFAASGATLLLILLVSAVAEHPENRSAQEIRSDQEIRSAQDARHLGVDEKVKDRYLADPKGYRWHPSYYSERYLKRGRTLTAGEEEMLAKQWGSWNLVDPQASSRPGNQFYDQYPNRDVPRADLVKAKAWQVDADYLPIFLQEGSDLVMRAMEAILAEYGRPMPPNLSAEEQQMSFEQRSAAFVPELIDVAPTDTSKWPKRGRYDAGSTSFMPKQSWDGLKKRLLHAVMSEDKFVLSMGGHSSATGHGNHFSQSYTLQYGRILEPILARLGVKGEARNFGMGGLGTLHNSLGAASIYGNDMDILFWDSGMTESEKSAIGLFATQGILASDRAPMLWVFQNKGIMEPMLVEAHADVALIGSGSALTPKANNLAELAQQTWAVRYQNCGNEVQSECKKNEYNGTCWIDRSSFDWEGIDLSMKEPLTSQNPVPGGRAGWHPGNRVHQLKGRMMAFVTLKALHEVLMDWKNAPNNELPDEAWHVTDYYKNIHDKVSSSTATDKHCEEKKLPLAFCRYRAQARTENTPRNRPWETNIRSIIKASGKTPTSGPNSVDPPDVYNPYLDPPPGEIDVLAIVENGVPFPTNLARIRDSAESKIFQAPAPRSLANPEATAPLGKGWHLGYDGADLCDGQYDSFCNRARSSEFANCHLYGHNDRREGIYFDGYSGWTVFSLPKVDHGAIMLKFHTWIWTLNPGTEGWCSENDETPCKQRQLRQPSHLADSIFYKNATQTRRLKPQTPVYCAEFKFQFAINGKVTTWDKDEFLKQRNQAQRVVELFTLSNDVNLKGTDIEVALRMIGCGRQKIFQLTHIYWA